MNVNECLMLYHISIVISVMCRLRTLWYTFTSLHNSVEIEVCEDVCVNIKCVCE